MGHASCDSTLRHQHSQDGSLQCQLCAKGITRAVILFEYSRQNMVPQPISPKTARHIIDLGKEATSFGGFLRDRVADTSRNSENGRAILAGWCFIPHLTCHLPTHPRFHQPGSWLRGFPRCLHGVSCLREFTPAVPERASLCHNIRAGCMVTSMSARLRRSPGLLGVPCVLCGRHTKAMATHPSCELPILTH